MGKPSKLFWRTDESIRSPELRVIGSDGKLIGILKRQEAIEKARQEDLTLVEIAPLAKPPVAKIVDFGKFKYQEEKKQRSQSKGSKKSETKEVRFSPFIAENDFNTRVERVKEFLEDRNKVRLVVGFKGRQMGSKQFGYKVLERIVKHFGDEIGVDMEPKFLGRKLMMVISPRSGGGNKKVETKKETDAKTEN